MPGARHSWPAFAFALALVLSTPALAAEGQAPSQPRYAQVEVILDASGSMKANLPGGQSRLEAAKKAIEEFAAGLPRGFDLALRAYGHTAARERHDCEDTEILLPFGRLDENRKRLSAILRPVTARGYTPITWVLGVAAKDFPPDAPGERIIVLVSDGRETCAGDPCATAKALSAAGVKRLVVHTVGFGVDEAARAELTCIASVTGGRYFDATDVASLAAALATAVITPGQQVTAPSGQGKLKFVSPSLAGHAVVNAESGQKVASLSRTQSTVSLPAGIYSVSVGSSAFKGVEVKPGETTTLTPARIEVTTPTVAGHDILDPETGEVVARVSATASSAVVLPGRYEVAFGEALWPVAVDSGQTLVLSPGVVVLVNAGPRFTYVFDTAGNKVGRLSNTQKWLPLPPGNYEIDLGERRERFSLGEGQRLELTR